MSYIIRHKETGLFYLGHGVPNYTINQKKAKIFDNKSLVLNTINSMKSINFYDDTLIYSICLRKGLEMTNRVFFSNKNKTCLKANINKEDLEIIKL